jgi:hypothetical protein
VPLARASLLAILCLASLAAAAQNPAAFTTSSPSSSTNSYNTYTADINNDGTLDLVQDVSTTPNGFTVSLAKGDGTFATPNFTAFAHQNGRSVSPLAIGDFNGDGKLDIAATFPGSNLVQVCLGKGDGTFERAISTTVSFIGGQSFAYAPIATADYNHDGKPDLVFAGTIGDTSTVYLLPGKGDGSFGAAIPLITPTATYSPDGSTIYNITTGDFDSNGSADIAFTAGNNNSGQIVTTVYVLYGNGDNTFSSRIAYSDNGQLSLASGDLNGDGFTDLFGLDSSNNRLVTLYSQPNDLTFTPYFTSLPGASDGNLYNFSEGAYTPPVSMADFNNDGLMDLVAYTPNFPLHTANLAFFLANYDQPGVFTSQLVSLPDYTYNTNPVVGDFNRDTKPDVAVVQFNDGYPQTLTTAINNTSGGGLWSNCAYPLVGNGLSLCSPTTSAGPGSPLSFNATSNSFGQIRKIELWVDGTKITEQHNTWGHNAFFDFVSNFNPGKHAATLYEADIDDTLQRLDFNFTVGPSTCPVTSAFITLCSPSDSTTSPLNVQFTANTDIIGPIERMEVWVDGVKKYTNSTGVSTVSTYVRVTPGSHMVAVYAIGTETGSWENGITTTTH